MNRRLTLSALGSIGALALVIAAPLDAGAQPPPPDVIAPPPPEVIATVEPVYYEGHPAYWYGGHWYWRDPHGWHWYANEPAFLRDHRAHEPPRRYHYDGRGYEGHGRRR
jgi:hypothetical protein